MGVGLAAVVAKKTAERAAEILDQEEKQKAELSDDNSYEYDDEMGEEESDEEIGMGYDDDSSIDLEEMTEADVQEKKLEVLRNKLEEDY